MPQCSRCREYRALTMNQSLMLNPLEDPMYDWFDWVTILRHRIPKIRHPWYPGKLVQRVADEMGGSNRIRGPQHVGFQLAYERETTRNRAKPPAPPSVRN